MEIQLRALPLKKMTHKYNCRKNNFEDTAIEKLENHTIIISINKSFDSPQSFDYFGTTFTEIFREINTLLKKMEHLRCIPPGPL